MSAETTLDRRPVVHDILVRRGILAGGANLTITGVRMNEYPVLGAHFTSEDDDDLPELYGYAENTLRFVVLPSWLCRVRQKPTPLRLTADVFKTPEPICAIFGTLHDHFLLNTSTC